MLTSDKDDTKKKDIVTMYRTQSKKLSHLSMDAHFYKHFCQEVLKDEGDRTEATKHRILLPVGQNCKPRYPATYEYAKGILIQYKPWSKDKPLTNLLKSKSRTIRTFKRMMDKKQFPSCVRNQYILAMKYSKQAKFEFSKKQSIPQPYDLSNMNDEEREAYIAHQNVSHFSDGKHHNKVIDGMTVNIGTNFDWSQSLFKEERDITIDGTSWVDTIREHAANAIRDQA